MEKIINEFVKTTALLDDCTTQFEHLLNQFNQLKQQYTGTPQQIAEAQKLEQQFKQLSQLTGSLKLKAAKLSKKKPTNA